jgi:hypothetical protein
VRHGRACGVCTMAAARGTCIMAAARGVCAMAAARGGVVWGLHQGKSEGVAVASLADGLGQARLA